MGGAGRCVGVLDDIPLQSLSIVPHFISLLALPTGRQAAGRFPPYFHGNSRFSPHRASCRVDCRRSDERTRLRHDRRHHRRCDRCVHRRVPLQCSRHHSLRFHRFPGHGGDWCRCPALPHQLDQKGVGFPIDRSTKNLATMREYFGYAICAPSSDFKIAEFFIPFPSIVNRSKRSLISCNFCSQISMN